MPNGKLEREGKACHTKDNNGNDVVCEESHTGEKLPSEGEERSLFHDFLDLLISFIRIRRF